MELFHKLANDFNISVYAIEKGFGEVIYKSPAFQEIEKHNKQRELSKEEQNLKNLFDANNLPSAFNEGFSSYHILVKRSVIPANFYKGFGGYIGQYLNVFIVKGGVEIPFKLENFISENKKGLYKSFMKCHTPSILNNNAIFENVTADDFKRIVKFYLSIRNMINETLMKN